MTLENIIVFFTLFILELILGVDNIIFLSLLTNKLNKEVRKQTRCIGLIIALILRIILLILASQIIILNSSIVTILDFNFSIKDLVMLCGGSFLTYNSVCEISSKIKNKKKTSTKIKPKTVMQVIIKIIFTDIIFSIDSIFTAFAITRNITIITLCFIISNICMMIFSEIISNYLVRYNTINILAMVFLLLIGIMTIFEGLHI